MTDATAPTRVLIPVEGGELPAYLVELQGRVGHPLADSGELTYAALTGDLHSHTDWSDGGSPLEEMALTAIELGQSWLAITDHSPRLKVANGLSAARLTQQIAREHRGSLAWRSRPGHTVFTLLLPLTEPNHDGAQP